MTLTVSRGPDLREVWVAGVGEGLGPTTTALAAAGLAVTDAGEHSDTVPAGTVLQMHLPDGTPVTKAGTYPVGTEVVVVSSDGPAPVTIPAVVGLARDQAVTTLTGLGLTVAETQAHHPSVAAGVVVAQDPVGGTAGHRLETVALVVSLGPEPPPAPTGVVIPRSVIGMNKFAALDLLAGKGFATAYERGTCTLDWAMCVVVRTVPAAGTTQPAGSKVTIWLADDPAGLLAIRVAIPLEVLGMAKHPALDLLASKGFDAAYDRGTCTLEWSQCVVDHTVPAAGTTQQKGSRVTIVLRDPV